MILVYSEVKISACQFSYGMVQQDKT